jgi:hypothetical protein
VNSDHTLYRPTEFVGYELSGHGEIDENAQEAGGIAKPSLVWSN